MTGTRAGGSRHAPLQQRISNECLLDACCAPVSFDTMALIAGRDSPILQTGKLRLSD